MALINCPECQKEISNKAKTCPHCGCPIERESKKENKKESKKRFSSKEYKMTGIILSIPCSLILLIFLLSITFNNVIISVLISTIYGGTIYILSKILLTTKPKIKKYLWLVIMIIAIPLLITLYLLTKNEEWKYDNFKSLSSNNFTYASLELNAFGNCKYYYSYDDTENEKNNVEIKTRKCTYKKGNNYTFTLEYNGEKSSFDCELNDGELRCPLQYTYPKKIITFKNQ